MLFATDEEEMRLASTRTEQLHSTVLLFVLNRVIGNLRICYDSLETTRPSAFS